MDREWKQWFIGLTDGEGIFTLVKKEKNWEIKFGIGHSKKNEKLIRMLKQKIGVGYINVQKSENLIRYEITDCKKILGKIIPIFEENPLLTSKKIDYKMFKEACEIKEKKGIGKEEKNKRLEELKRKWEKEKETIIQKNPLTKESQEVVEGMTDDWLIGFWEAIGTFCISKSGEKYKHEITITRKLDKRILNTIKERLKMTTQVYFKKERNCFQLNSQRKEVIEIAAELFKDRLKGRQRLEYEIWAEAIKYRGDYKKLKEVQQEMREIREKGEE